MMTTKTITPEDVAAATPNAAQFWHVTGTTTTVCALELANGFVVIGKSGCVDPSAYNAELGEQYAYDDALRQVPELLAFKVMRQ